MKKSMSAEPSLLRMLCAVALLVAGCSDDPQTISDSDSGAESGASTGVADGGGTQAADGGGTLAKDGGTGAKDAGRETRDASAAGGGDAQADASSCGASPFDATQVPANVLLVVDASGSMADVPSGFGESKWEALGGALDTALGDAQDMLRFGLDLYPSATEGIGCSARSGEVNVAFGSGTAHVDEVVDALAARVPAGGTPTAAALTRALDFYLQGEGASLDGDRHVLLATDGGPNCNEALSCDADRCVTNLEPGRCEAAMCCGANCCAGAAGLGVNCLDDAATVAAVRALADAGIPTVVVGIPGSETFADELDAIADAGGMGSGGVRNYYAVTSAGSGAGGLVDVLRNVTRELIHSCALQLGSQPPDPGKLNVEVDGETLAQDGPDGWELDASTSPPTIRLKGATCREVEQSGVEQVSVTFGCPTRLI